LENPPTAYRTSAIVSTVNLAFGLATQVAAPVTWDPPGEYPHPPLWDDGRTFWDYTPQPPSLSYPVAFQALDESDQLILADAVIVNRARSPILWDGASVNWDAPNTLWDTGLVTNLAPYVIPWNTELVFSRLVLRLSVIAASAFKVANAEVRYRPLNYAI